MKWCFLANDAPFLMEFLGKLAHQVVGDGDECLVLVNSKIAEYSKKRFFPSQAKFISKVDWCSEQRELNSNKITDISWKEFFSTFDRYSISYSYQGAADIVSQLYHFTDFVFKTEKPDIVVSELPSGIHNEIVFHFCRKNGVPYLGITDSLFDTLAVYDKGWTDSRFETTFDKLTKRNISKKEKSVVETWIDAFVSHKRVPGYTKAIKVYFGPFAFLVHYLQQIPRVGGVLLKYAMQRRRFAKYDYESEAVLKHSLIAPFEMARRQFRISLQKRFYSPFNQKDKFFLYPLQFQPEASTSVMAPYYTNQLYTIQNIAFSIPFPYKLYVKEHPSAVGKKPDAFYESLRRIPNVVLIQAKESAAKLIQASSGVVALTSMMGLEAALAGKPSYIFGNSFYAYHPLCRRVRNFDELRERIQEDLDNPISMKDHKDMNLRFGVSYFRNTVEGEIGASSDPKDTNNYKAMLAAFRERTKSRE